MEGSLYARHVLGNWMNAMSATWPAMRPKQLQIFPSHSAAFVDMLMLVPKAATCGCKRALHLVCTQRMQKSCKARNASTRVANMLFDICIYVYDAVQNFQASLSSCPTWQCSSALQKKRLARSCNQTYINFAPNCTCLHICAVGATDAVFFRVHTMFEPI